MTNAELITRSLRLIGVLSEVENASAEQGNQGIEVLNDMLAAWERDEINLGYYAQNDLTAETPIPDHAKAAVRYFLAFALAPEYGKTVSAEMYAAGDGFYSRLIKDSVLENMRQATLDHLPTGEGQVSSDNLFN